MNDYKFLTIIFLLVAITAISFPIISVCSFAIGLTIYIISELKAGGARSPAQRKEK